MALRRSTTLEADLTTIIRSTRRVRSDHYAVGSFNLLGVNPIEESWEGGGCKVMVRHVRTRLDEQIQNVQRGLSRRSPIFAL